MKRSKKDKPKDKLSYKHVDFRLLQCVARVMCQGETNHAPNDWRHRTVAYHTDCLTRHFIAWNKGENNDPESKLPHLWHMATRIMMLLVIDRNSLKAIEEITDGK